MGMGFIARQPNGLLCRYSNVVDCITHWNMTEEEYKRNITGTVIIREQGAEVLKSHVENFSEVLRLFSPNDNMSQEEFDEILEEMNIPMDELVDRLRRKLDTYKRAVDRIGILGHIDIHGDFEKAYNQCLYIVSEAVKEAGDDE